MEDILGAVPIDKWFEMFKPSAAGGGGFIRVHISFSEKSPAEARKASPPDELATPMGRYRSKFQQLLKATPVKAEARVALLEARVDSLQSKEQEPAAVQNKPQVAAPPYLCLSCVTFNVQHRQHLMLLCLHSSSNACRHALLCLYGDVKAGFKYACFGQSCLASGALWKQEPVVYIFVCVTVYTRSCCTWSLCW